MRTFTIHSSMAATFILVRRVLREAATADFWCRLTEVRRRHSKTAPRCSRTLRRAKLRATSYKTQNKTNQVCMNSPTPLNGT